VLFGLVQYMLPFAVLLLASALHERFADELAVAVCSL